MLLADTGLLNMFNATVGGISGDGQSHSEQAEQLGDLNSRNMMHKRVFPSAVIFFFWKFLLVSVWTCSFLLLTSFSLPLARSLLSAMVLHGQLNSFDAITYSQCLNVYIRMNADGRLVVLILPQSLLISEEGA